MVHAMHTRSRVAFAARTSYSKSVHNVTLRQRELVSSKYSLRLQPGKGVVTTLGEGDTLAVGRSDDLLSDGVGSKTLGEAGRTLDTVMDKTVDGPTVDALEDNGARSVGKLVLLKLGGTSSVGDTVGAELAAVDVSTAVDSRLDSFTFALERAVSEEAVDTPVEGLGAA